MNIRPFEATTGLTKLPNRKIEFIVIHYTAGGTSEFGSAHANAKWFNTNAAKASADFIIDRREIVQFNTDIKNHATWHCGGSKVGSLGGQFYGVCKNANSIGIELCSDNPNGLTYPNDPNYSIHPDVFSQAVELTRALMRIYNIDAENVIRHFDVTGKICPGVVGWNEASGDTSEWLKFRLSLHQEIPSPWAAEAWEWGIEAGITDGSAPGRAATREEVMTMLYRAKGLKG